MEVILRYNIPFHERQPIKRTGTLLEGSWRWTYLFFLLLRGSLVCLGVRVFAAFLSSLWFLPALSSFYLLFSALITCYYPLLWGSIIGPKSYSE